MAQWFCKINRLRITNPSLSHAKKTVYMVNGYLMMQINLRHVASDYQPA